MAGSLEDFEAQSRELERIAVLHCHESVFGLGAGAEMDRRAATVAQLEMSRDEVGMEVSQKNVADPHSQPLGISQVLLDVPLRIDHDCAGASFVGYEVRRVGEAAQ